VCAVRSVKFCVVLAAASVAWWQIVESDRVRRNQNWTETHPNAK